MASSNGYVSLTVDDFDPLFKYSDYTQWQTPNPQDSPTWWNASSSETGSSWHEATYHYTTDQGATASLNFTASSVKIYGAGGPSGTNYTISIDKTASQPFSQSFNTQNATEGRTLLYSTDQLTYSPHQLEIVNHGSGLLLDVAVIDVQLGADGSTLSNTTVQNDDSKLVYSGSWTTQDGDNFSGGTSTYTGSAGSSVSLSFEGSAFYAYGDQVNDHGLYEVFVNGSSAGIYTGRSGCGGGYAKHCEKLHGLMVFVGNLPQGTHNVTIANEQGSGSDNTYFDLDYLEFTTPSEYALRGLSSGSSPFQSSSSPSGSSSVAPGIPTSSTAPGSGASTASTAKSTSAAELTNASATGLVCAVMGLWIVKKVFPL